MKTRRSTHLPPSARILSLLMCTLLISTGTACQKRENNSSSTPSSSLSSAVAADNSAKEVLPDDNQSSSASQSPSSNIDDKIADTSGDASEELTGIPDEGAEASAAPAMSGSFSDMYALDGKKLGWGPGGPTDSVKRPDGATVYQKKYAQYDAVFIGENEPKVYLTFDEGYENGYTAKILDTLKEKGAHAVFFVTMPYVKEEPELVQRMINEGHTVGNHSTKHLSFPDMPLQEAADDIMKLHDYVKENFGYEMNLFRPPMGEFNERTLAIAKSLNYKSVFWSFAYRDWLVDNQPLTIEAFTSIVDKAHPGAVYLLHAVSKTNSEVLGDAIDAFREMGLEVADWDI